MTPHPITVDVLITLDLTLDGPATKVAVDAAVATALEPLDWQLSGYDVGDFTDLGPKGDDL